MNIKNSIKDVLVLTLICVVFGAALAGVNMITAPIIAEMEAAATAGAYKEVMPDAVGFETVDITQYELPTSVKEVLRETSGQGYAVKIETSGYNSGLVIIVGVSADGTVIRAVCSASNETNKAEGTYGENFTGKDINGVNSVDTVTGSTMTTKAYRNAVVDAINTVTVVSGGSADFRTEEEKFADNLAAALPAGEGKFTKLFLVEVVEGIDQIYAADNDAGYVCVIGSDSTGTFIGVDANGVATGEASAEHKALAEAAVATVSATVLTDVDISAFEGIHARVNSVQKTETGNYVVELRCDGFGMHGDKYYMPSGKEFIIKVSITADGVLIDATTVEQYETDGIGSVQLEEGAYDSQFIGKTQEEANSVDTVTGCTLTTKAFKQAVIRAFEAVTIIEGGATNE